LYCAAGLLLLVACLLIAGGSSPHWQPFLIGRDKWLYAGAYMLGMWCWTFGIIGVALRFLSHESPARRYVADSSYWLYLMHVPVLIFFDVLLNPLPWHWSVKYVLSLVCAVPILLLSYHTMVRFTAIGAVLNGRRHPRRASGGGASSPQVSV
jgi:hypothetical protein